MVTKYGSDNGFGWNLNEIVGAQIVSVPFAVPLAQANAAFLIFMVILAVMFVVVLLILNAIANAVSLGQDAEEYEKPGNDEISSLSASFNRMRRSLDSAMRMLTP
jgi:protein-histidine pros-kinase